MKLKEFDEEVTNEIKQILNNKPLVYAVFNDLIKREVKHQSENKLFFASMIGLVFGMFICMVVLLIL